MKLSRIVFDVILYTGLLSSTTASAKGQRDSTQIETSHFTQSTSHVTSTTSMAAPATGALPDTMATTIPPSIVTGSSPTEARNLSFGNPAAENVPKPIAITPTAALAGVVMLVTGVVHGIVGILDLRLHVFFSAGFAASLVVACIVIFLEKRDDNSAKRVGFFFGTLFGGIAAGLLAQFFLRPSSRAAPFLSCLIGGFCLSMWFLCLKSGGLVSSTAPKAIFICIMSVAAALLPFFKLTRLYGRIVSAALVASTVAILGADCFWRAGLKEIWIYNLGFNMELFPLSTTTYTVTKDNVVELILVWFLTGLVSFAAHHGYRDTHIIDLPGPGRNWAVEDPERQEAEIGIRTETMVTRARTVWERTYGKKDEEDAKSNKEGRLEKSKKDSSGKGVVRNRFSFEMDDLNRVEEQGSHSRSATIETIRSSSTGPHNYRFPRGNSSFTSNLDGPSPPDLLPLPRALSKIWLESIAPGRGGNTPAALISLPRSVSSSSARGPETKSGVDVTKVPVQDTQQSTSQAQWHCSTYEISQEELPAGPWNHDSASSSLAGIVDELDDRDWLESDWSFWLSLGRATPLPDTDGDIGLDDPEHPSEEVDDAAKREQLCASDTHVSSATATTHSNDEDIAVDATKDGETLVSLLVKAKEPKARSDSSIDGELACRSAADVSDTSIDQRRLRATYDQEQVKNLRSPTPVRPDNPNTAERFLDALNDRDCNSRCTRTQRTFGWMKEHSTPRNDSLLPISRSSSSGIRIEVNRDSRVINGEGAQTVAEGPFAVAEGLDNLPFYSEMRPLGLINGTNPPRNRVRVGEDSHTANKMLPETHTQGAVPNAAEGLDSMSYRKSHRSIESFNTMGHASTMPIPEVVASSEDGHHTLLLFSDEQDASSVRGNLQRRGALREVARSSQTMYPTSRQPRKRNLLKDVAECSVDHEQGSTNVPDMRSPATVGSSREEAPMPSKDYTLLEQREMRLSTLPTSTYFAGMNSFGQVPEVVGDEDVIPLSELKKRLHARSSNGTNVQSLASSNDSMIPSLNSGSSSSCNTENLVPPGLDRRHFSRDLGGFNSHQPQLHSGYKPGEALRNMQAWHASLGNDSFNRKSAQESQLTAHRHQLVYQTNLQRQQEHQARMRYREIEEQRSAQMFHSAILRDRHNKQLAAFQRKAKTDQD